MRIFALPLVFVFFACVEATSPPLASATITAGPMVGSVTHETARVWVQTAEEAQLHLEIRAEGKDWMGFGPGGVHLTRENQFSGFAEVRVQPNTRYQYRFVSDHAELLPVSEQSFRTPPAPDESGSFTVAFGSCAGSWGLHPDQPIWRAINNLHPDVFLWLGDNIYFERDTKEWEDVGKMQARWKTQRAMPSLQPMLRRTVNLATWDDHDYGPNNSDGTWRLKEESLKLFRNYWANPDNPTSVPGVMHSYRWGKVEFFLLDTRFHRSPNKAKNGPGKSVLGETQWAWLEHALKTSAADFKVIVSAMQVLPDYHDFESWKLFPSDRQRLFDFLANHQITGAFILSGDRHIGELLQREIPRLPYPLTEFTASPLAAGFGTPPPDEQVPSRVPGTSVEGEQFGVLRFTTPQDGPPYVELQAFHADGKPAWKARRIEITDLGAQGD